ncbi:MAG: type IV secretion system DNA-binding domain-containing protein [Coleofasciculaceae cyanobacterium]
MPAPQQPPLTVAGIELPCYLENLGFFTVGSPGSGKSVSISELLQTMRQRSDFRAFVFDRNGEMLEKFYREGDIIFNPNDQRSVQWSHKNEPTRAETIAAALIPSDPKEPFFSDAARSLLSDLYERCHNSAEVWEVISTFTQEEIQTFCQGGLSSRYLDNPKTGGSVMSTLVNHARFYRDLSQLASDNGFSFMEWAASEDKRWVWLPLFESDAELYKPLYSCAFELMIRGLLSQEGRSVKTAVVIDELGALNKLTSLTRLGAEARKFGGSLVLGTQSTAQIKKVYGRDDGEIVLQCTATKLILNCRDPQTAETFAKVIGQQERVDIAKSHTPRSGLTLTSTQTVTSSEQIRETYAVMPSQLQALPPLQGYLVISDGTPPALVRVQPRSLEKVAERLIPGVLAR